jgi:hypothetical protein
MIHEEFLLQITDTFKTEVEITGNSQSNTIIFFSHGFGVKRDSKGLFTDIENVLKEQYLCVRFDYTFVDSEKNTHMQSFTDMALTLERVTKAVKEKYANKDSIVLAHSMGCVVSVLANLEDVKEYVLLCPSFVSGFDRFTQFFSTRPGTHFDFEGISWFTRSHGARTYIPKEFFMQYKDINPVDVYKQKSSHFPITIVKAAQDEMVKDSYDDISKVSQICTETIDSDHNFTGVARNKLISFLDKKFIIS